MNDLYLALTAIAILFAWLYTVSQKDKEMREQREQWIVERESWQSERQQLLDRIQAPTFSEYKHQEAKVIKAKNGTDKPDVVIEQL